MLSFSKHYDRNVPEPPTITLVKRKPQTYTLPAQSDAGFVSCGNGCEKYSQEQDLEFPEGDDYSYSYSYSYSDDQLNA